jgi:hypothetical protein
MTMDAGPDEKSSSSNGPDRSPGAVVADPADRWARTRAFLRRAAAFGRVEVQGITPIPVKERTVERTINMFTLWWSMNTNILG